jgi:hypothetical protein
LRDNPPGLASPCKVSITLAEASKNGERTAT